MIDESKKKFPLEGIELWKNPKNKFTVFQIHYTANQFKQSEEWKKHTSANLSRKRWMQEYEISWEAQSGKPIYSDYSKKIHGAYGLTPEPGLPLLRGWDFGLCYDDETEVLTRAGWKLFKDVDQAEDVATLNPAGFKMTYEVPSLKVDMPYSGEMITWDSENLQACITPDHIVPVWNEESKKPFKFYAKDLMGQGHNLIRLTSKWDGIDVENELKLSPKLFAAFMGAYLSEGSCEKNRVSIYQRDSNKKWLREILEPTEWDWRETPGGFRYYCPEVASYLASFGLSGDKRVPDEIRFGTSEVIAEFIRTYTLGDGHIRTRENGSEEHTIYSKSKRMIDDLSELALKVGWTSSIKAVKSQSSYFSEEDRWITSSPGWIILFKKTADWSHLRGAKKEVKAYSGRVYCLSVSSGILCVRKNGRPHWNGNTPACIVAQLQGRQLIVLREFVAVNMGIKRFASEVVLPECRIHYPGWSNTSSDWIDFIDPAGLTRVQTDETTCAQHMAAAGIKKVFPGAIDWESRRESVESFLIKFIRRGNEILPCFQIDMANCPVLHQGFTGGYQYPDSNIEIEPQKIRPLKNKFSHPHDGLQMISSMAAALIRPGRGVNHDIPVPGYMGRQNR